MGKGVGWTAEGLVEPQGPSVLRVATCLPAVTQDMLFLCPQNELGISEMIHCMVETLDK